MSTHRVWKRLVGVEHTVIEVVDVVVDGGAETVVVRVRPTRSRRGRCSRCGRRAGRYDAGGGRRRWRAIDLGTVLVELEADVSPPGFRAVPVSWFRPWGKETGTDGTTEEVLR